MSGLHHRCPLAPLFLSLDVTEDCPPKDLRNSSLGWRKTERSDGGWGWSNLPWAHGGQRAPDQQPAKLFQITPLPTTSSSHLQHVTKAKEGKDTANVCSCTSIHAPPCVHTSRPYTTYPYPAVCVWTTYRCTYLEYFSFMASFSKVSGAFPPFSRHFGAHSRSPDIFLYPRPS